jgi:hypothetical protein
MKRKSGSRLIAALISVSLSALITAYLLQKVEAQQAQQKTCKCEITIAKLEWNSSPNFEAGTLTMKLRAMGEVKVNSGDNSNITENWKLTPYASYIFQTNKDKKNEGKSEGKDEGKTDESQQPKIEEMKDIPQDIITLIPRSGKGTNRCRVGLHKFNLDSIILTVKVPRRLLHTLAMMERAVGTAEAPVQLIIIITVEGVFSTDHCGIKAVESSDQRLIISFDKKKEKYYVIYPDEPKT